MFNYHKPGGAMKVRHLLLAATLSAAMSTLLLAQQREILEGRE
jgi:hypothetical protein